MQQKRACSLGLILITAVCVSVGCGGGDVPTSRSSNATEKVAALFEDFSVGDSPGAAVVVIENGKKLFEGGFGLADLETQTPITPQTASRLASVSKQFTAMAIMILAPAT